MEQVFNFLLQNYGAFGLILVILILLGWFMIKELRKSNEALITAQRQSSSDLANSVASSITTLSQKLTDDLRQQNKDLLKFIMDKDSLSHDIHNQEMIYRRNVTTDINTLIHNLLLEMGAQRVCVLEFHNSLYNQTGFPFLKYTVTYEKISKGCMTIQQRYQGAQFSSISDVCNKLLISEDHILELHSIDDIDTLVPIMLCEGRQDVGSVIFKGLFEPQKNELFGLICIEFENEIPKNYNRTTIVSTARMVSELITLVNISKEKEEIKKL